MYPEFKRIMTEVLSPKSLRGTKYKKYLDLKKNFDRTNKQIQSLLANDHTCGLDFGCGVGFSLILGKLHGIDIIGLDIPHYSGKNPVYDAEGGASPFLTSQNKLKEMGYSVVLRDTMKFPWNEFKDNQFEFVMSFFAITKHFDNRVKWDWQKRLQELKRVTKPAGTWYIGPKRHYVTVQRQLATLEDKIKLHMWGTKQIS